MRKIAENFKGSYLQIILGPLFKLFEAILELFVPLVMAKIIDNGIRTKDTAYIYNGGLTLIIIAVLSIAAAMVCQYFAASAAGRFGTKLRAQLYTHIMSLSSKDTSRFGAGGLITRLTNDVNQIQNGINMVIRLATRAPFLAIGSIIMACTINLRIGLIFLATTPLLILAIIIVMRRTLPSYVQIQSGQDKLSRLSSENLDGIRVIRAFARQNNEKQEFDTAAQDLTAITVRVGKISAALNPVTTFIVNLAIIAIVWFGAKFAFAGKLATGEIIALVNYMGQTLLALIVVANLIVYFTRGIASAHRVADVLNTKPSITSGKGAAENPNSPVLEMKNVNFAYHENAEDAISNINFVVHAGQTIGIIGGTGSGKSTLVNLIARFHDAQSGEILLNGAPIQNFTLEKLQKKIGLVPQRAALFTGSVRHNLLIAGKTLSDETLWQALKIAQSDDFVQKMPKQLNATIAEGGKNLSGGQRQRLTIARALVGRPEILILDDCASALDYATDAALRKALNDDKAKTGNKRTTLIVSQRASTIKDANFILVMDDGKIASKGSHKELLQTSEIYREICASQGILPEGQVG